MAVLRTLVFAVSMLLPSAAVYADEPHLDVTSMAALKVSIASIVPTLSPADKSRFTKVLFALAAYDPAAKTGGSQLAALTKIAADPQKLLDGLKPYAGETGTEILAAADAIRSP